MYELNVCPYEVVINSNYVKIIKKLDKKGIVKPNV